MDFREFLQLIGMRTAPFDELSPYDKLRIIDALPLDVVSEIKALKGPPIPQDLKDRFDRAIKRSMSRKT